MQTEIKQNPRDLTYDLIFYRLLEVVEVRCTCSCKISLSQVQRFTSYRINREKRKKTLRQCRKQCDTECKHNWYKCFTDWGFWWWHCADVVQGTASWRQGLPRRTPPRSREPSLRHLAASNWLRLSLRMLSYSRPLADRAPSSLQLCHHRSFID